MNRIEMQRTGRNGTSRSDDDVYRRGNGAAAVPSQTGGRPEPASPLPGQSAGLTPPDHPDDRSAAAPPSRNDDETEGAPAFERFATVPALAPPEAAADGWLEWLPPEPADSASDAAGDMPAGDADTDIGGEAAVVGDRNRADTLDALAEALPAQRDARKRRRRRSRVIVAAAAALLLAMTVAAVWVVGGRNDTSTPAAPAAAVPHAPNAAAGAGAANTDWCPATNTGPEVIGHAPGDTASPVGVVMALEHAMYVQRDPAAARALMAPGARTESPAALAAAITAIRPGTDYCVHTVAVAPDRLDVTVAERGGNTWHEGVTTVAVAGRTLISEVVGEP